MSEISMNSNNLYAVQRRPVQTMPEAAKASFKGAPEPEEKEGWSTTAKVGAAVAVLGAAGLICYLTCGRGLPKDVAQAIKNALEGTQDLTNKSKESLREIIKNLDSAISKAEGAKVAEDNADLKKMKETLAEAKKQLDNILNNEEKAAAKAAEEQAAKQQTEKAAQRAVAIRNAVDAANKAIADCNTQLCSKGYGENAVSKIDDVLAKLTPDDAGYEYWTKMKNEYVEKSRQVKDLVERKEKILTIGYNEQTYEQDLKKVDSLIAEFEKFGLDDDVKFLKDVKERLISSDTSRKQGFSGGNNVLNEAANGTKDSVSGNVITGQEKPGAKFVEKGVSGSGAAEITVSEPFIEAERGLNVVNEAESEALNNSKKNINENSIKVDDTTTPEVKPSDKTPVAEDLQPSPQPLFGENQVLSFEDFKKEGNKIVKGIARTKSGDNFTGSVSHEKGGKTIVSKYKDGILESNSIYKDEKFSGSLDFIRTDGNVTKTVRKDSKGAVLETVTYEYDKNIGNPVSIKKFVDGGPSDGEALLKSEKINVNGYDGILVTSQKGETAVISDCCGDFRVRRNNSLVVRDNRGVSFVTLDDNDNIKSFRGISPTRIFKGTPDSFDIYDVSGGKKELFLSKQKSGVYSLPKAKGSFSIDGKTGGLKGSLYGCDVETVFYPDDAALSNFSEWLAKNGVKWENSQEKVTLPFLGDRLMPSWDVGEVISDEVYDKAYKEIVYDKSIKGLDITMRDESGQLCYYTVLPGEETVRIGKRLCKKGTVDFSFKDPYPKVIEKIVEELAGLAGIVNVF